jgi:hypothetical protein
MGVFLDRRLVIVSIVFVLQECRYPFVFRAVDALLLLGDRLVKQRNPNI